MAAVGNLQVAYCRCGMAPTGERVGGIIPRYRVRCARCGIGFTGWLSRRLVVGKWQRFQSKLHALSAADYNRAKRKAEKAVKKLYK